MILLVLDDHAIGVVCTRRQTIHFLRLEIFSKRARKLFTEAEVEALATYLALNPAKGDVIPGTGGLRKLRGSLGGRGKRGGSWVIYYYHHPDSLILLLRVLLELAVDNYVTQTKLATVNGNDKLAKKILKVAENLHHENKISAKYRDVLKKMQNSDELISADTLNRYVHSSQFFPSSEHLKAMWDTMADFIVLCVIVLCVNAPTEN